MKLTQKEIAYLAELLPNKSKLSIFSNIKVATDGTEQKTLTEKGILKNGKIMEPANGVLSVVAETGKCTRLVLKDSGFLLEKYTYSGKNSKGKELIVLVENDNGDMVFSILENSQNLIMALSELTGMSFVKSADVEILLSPKELMVLLAAVDLYRQNALLAYFERANQAEFQLEDLIRQLNNPQKNSMVKMMVNNYNYSAPIENEIKGILIGLVEKNRFLKWSKVTV